MGRRILQIKTALLVLLKLVALHPVSLSERNLKLFNLGLLLASLGSFRVQEEGTAAHWNLLSRHQTIRFFSSVDCGDSWALPPHSVLFHYCICAIFYEFGDKSVAIA